MDLLTNEQRQDVERLREHLKWRGYEPGASAVEILIEVIDSIAPRQYTEQELREAYIEIFSDETGEDNSWDG